MIYGVVDCDSFYASCERIFRPDLATRPVAVLSNNDGCVIALTAELKRAGLAIGVPLFQCRARLRQLDATVFSANFVLYGDISARVMALLREHFGAIVVYSIDEAFFTLAAGCANPHALARAAREQIGRHVGVPVTIGLGPTYTLAKAALGIAKKRLVDASGVHWIAGEREREFALRRIGLGDVWGLGRRFVARHDPSRSMSAWDFANLATPRLGERLDLPRWSTYCELNGIPSISLAPPPRRRSLIHSRSFPSRVTSRARLGFIVRYLATCAARRLREHDLVAQAIRLELGPAMRRRRLPSVSLGATLDQPSADTFVLLAAVDGLLAQLYVPGCAYLRAGVVLHELGERRQGELDFGGDAPQRKRRERLHAGIDRLNRRYGRDTVGFGPGRWRQRRERLSPCYTTRVADVCKVG